MMDFTEYGDFEIASGIPNFPSVDPFQFDTHVHIISSIERVLTARQIGGEARGRGGEKSK